MKFVVARLKSLGYNPRGPLLDKPKGFISPGYHIEIRRDYWKVVITRFEEAQRLLRMLPVRHSERTRKKALALSLPYRPPWDDFREQVQTLRVQIRAERDKFVQEAQLKHELLHKSVRKKLEET
jgi:hypothetical protein